MNKKNINNPLLSSINEYLAHLQFERRLSLNTVKSYNHDLKKYIKFLYTKENIKSPSIIDHKIIEKFIGCF